ncbi:MAG: DNA polymerase IV [Clostridiaceae bacterium]|jgi:DNA polymerase-4|nr:DNA polymerase IV [Clostridiaceae bacterium]
MNRRIIFHVDVNSAFLSWSSVYALQHGCKVDFRTVPAIVGGNQATRHGIVLAKSIPAKKYGIQTGEPIVDARRKCPALVVIPPDYILYMKCSEAMIKILKEYSDQIQIFSIDECFIDMTCMQKLLGGDYNRIATEIKDRIKNELGFTVSIGISTNKLLAKMGSDLQKPDAVVTLFPEEIKKKMWPLPVRDLYMCGKATEKKLHGMGIYTIGDLAQTEPEYLKYKLKSWGEMLYNFAHGIENSQVNPNGSIPYIKGIGNSCTIHFDVEDYETAHKVLLSLVETVGMRLRRGNFCCRLVQVSIKTNKLTSYSHQRKFEVPTDCTNAIYEEVCRLFDNAWKGEPIRHLGVRVSELCGNDFIQLSLFDKNWEKHRLIDRAIDEIRMKYGSHSVFRAGFLYSGLAPLQGGIVEDFPVMSSIL